MMFDIDGNDRLRQEFSQFHRDNPRVWDLFKKFAMQAALSGRKQYGAQTIIERIRYHTDIETVENGRNKSFKLSNIHVAFYARMFHRHFPEYDGFFRVRNSAADDTASGRERIAHREEVEEEEYSRRARLARQVNIVPKKPANTPPKVIIEHVDLSRLGQKSQQGH